MTVEIGRTELRLRFSFAAVVTVMLLFCEEKIVLMSLFSSVIHESGHLFFMFLSSEKINYVELSLFGMRIEKQSTFQSYKKEALSAMGGIIFNFIFAFVSVLICLISGKEDFFVFAAVNGFVALINMIPVRVLDAGRCINCFLSQKYDEETAEKVLDIFSFVFTVFLDAVCILYCSLIGFNISLVAVTVYLNIITFKKKWS